MDIKDLELKAPGPGLWFTDPEHTPRPLTALNAIAMAEMMSGFRIGAARYGWLTDGMWFALLHRFLYFRPRNLVVRPPGPDEVARKTFDALVAANPELQERIARSDEALRTRRWREDARHWDEVGKPWMLGRTLELTDVDPSALDDEALCTHVDEALHHLGRANEYHHILNPISNCARGMLFMSLYNWARVPANEVEPLLVGSSPISAGDEPELRRLTAALEKEPAAVALLDATDDAAARIDELCARDGQVGEAARAYVRMTGYRTIVGWEPMEPYSLEQPGLILTAIRHGLERGYASVNPQAIDAMRERVPAEHREQFDELLADAREYGRIRDERDIYCNVPAGGLLRRAVLEAGRRALERGLIDELEHVTEASNMEVRSLLLEGKGPSAAALAERHDYRFRYTTDDVPPVLGEGDEQPVPLKWLPQAHQIFTKMNISQRDPLASSGEEDSAEQLHGRGVSPGVHEGTARVVTTPDGLDAIGQGDVLVTFATSPAFNLVFPRIGALVTERGGLLSHAAIVAREFGLPAVIGAKKATEKIRNGDRVRVDADEGVVTILR